MSKTIICETYLNLGHPLTPELRRFYLRRVHKRALQRYVPAKYDGHVVLFKAAETNPDRHSIWSELIDGRLDSFEVPGDHSTFLRGGNVELWAKALQQHLEKAQLASAVF
jgi:hypothetical protein